MIINRRKFLADTTMTAAGLMIGAGVRDVEFNGDPASSSYSIMKEAMKYRKIDSHVHVNLFSDPGPVGLLDFADRLGIEKLVISRPVTELDRPHQDFKDSNDIVISAKKQFPDRFLGQFTLNPMFKKESLEEIKRCVDLGLVGLKVYYQVKINDPIFYPVIEKMIDLKMIILMHAFCQLGRGGYRTKYGKDYANESIPEDFADVAGRYPEAMFQFAHIGGGGDWQYECKVLKNSPNVFVDVSGSNNEENMINYAIKYLGEDRLVFGTDNSYYQGVSKILSADLTNDQRKKIFFENYNNLLRKGGYNVD